MESHSHFLILMNMHWWQTWMATVFVEFIKYGLLFAPIGESAGPFPAFILENSVLAEPRVDCGIETITVILFIVFYFNPNLRYGSERRNPSMDAFMLRTNLNTRNVCTVMHHQMADEKETMNYRHNYPIQEEQSSASVLVNATCEDKDWFQIFFFVIFIYP